MTSSDDDKTIVQPRGNGKPLTPAEIEKRKKLMAQKRQAEEKKRLEAQKRAQQLEKKLAKQKRDKESLANPDSTEVADYTRVKPVDDRTRFQSRPQPKPQHSPDDGDKTRFAPPKRPVDPDMTVAAESPAKDGIHNGPGFQSNQDSGAEVLKNRFILEKVLGAGGMGVVYRARDRLKEEAQDRDPHVAIKVLSNEFKTHPEAFIALQRESRRTQRIAHPNIVNVHDFDRDGDTVFMTMEYLEGKPLDKLISQYRSTGLPEEDVWKILEGISSALIYAHDQRIVHADFKPGNIFVTNETTAKVFDFGIARAVAKAEKIEESVDDKTIFDAGNLGALTPAYASYEMLEGMAPDIRDDIYALGCIAYEMFTGNHPFNRVHANEAYARKLKPKRIPNITKRQWKAIEKALAFKREDRIESVDEFWHQITAKRKSIVVAASVGLVVVGLVSALVYQNYMRPDNTFDTTTFRSELEREFEINKNKEEVIELLEENTFTKSWESKMWDAMQFLRSQLPQDDPWILEYQPNIYDAYVGKIKELVSRNRPADFNRARELVENIKRYSNDEEAIAALLNSINLAEADYQKALQQQKKQQEIAAVQQQEAAKKAVQQKKIKEEYDTALATVNSQLLCRTTINMRDVDIAVNKLRSLNISRYRKDESDMVTRLGKCISKIGQTFPDRAQEFKKRALRTFPNNKLIAGLKIEPRDPCRTSLAGLGTRDNAYCRDPLNSQDGESLGKGPTLVVIPAKGSVKLFAIGKYEITIRDFNRFCRDTAQCAEKNGDDKLPITNISSSLINQYISWLNTKSKRKYRLPTKAEWTYAALANSSSVDDNRNCRLDSLGIKRGGVLQVATSGRQNKWGLINHVGNARELVLDGGGYVAVGGSFDSPMENCVVSTSSSHSGKADKYTGIRLLREIGK